MCRSIKPLHNFEPPATPDEARAAAHQYVKKIGGFARPSKANEAAYDAAVDAVATASLAFLAALETHAPPKHRDDEARKARERFAKRAARATG